MLIKSSEIEIILEQLYRQKLHVQKVEDFVTLVKQESEWENLWFEAVEFEENQNFVRWLSGG